MPGRLTRVDLSASTALPHCTCGWRGNPTDRATAQRAADAHRRTAHAAAYKDTRNKRRRRQEVTT